MKKEVPTNEKKQNFLSTTDFSPNNKQPRKNTNQELPAYAGKELGHNRHEAFALVLRSRKKQEILADKRRILNEKISQL